MRHGTLVKIWSSKTRGKKSVDGIDRTGPDIRLIRKRTDGYT